MYSPKLERGKSVIVTHRYFKNGDKKQPSFKDESREFSLNYFTRGRKKVGA